MTWINIDCETMRVVHKHDDIEVVRMLAHIECTGRSVLLECGSAYSLMQFEVMELRDLYKASTGHSLITYDNHMARCIADACNRMPATDARDWDVRVQRYAISFADKKTYKYDPKKMVPIAMPDDWRPPAIKVDRLLQMELDTKYVTL